MTRAGLRSQTNAIHEGRATSGADGQSTETSAGDADDVQFWREIETSFPSREGPINLINTGGGACPTSVLEQLADRQIRAAAGEEIYAEEFAALKESGSSAALRRCMAETFGCDAEEIALTRNAMEGLAIGLLGIDMKPGDEVLTTRDDYDACIQILRQREFRDGIRLKLIDLPPPDAPDQEFVRAFEDRISSRTRVILMCHMLNKTGQILPVRQIADMARRNRVMTIVDGAQSLGQFDFAISDLGCDVFGASLHKWFYAPRGTGILYVRQEAIETIWPIWASWSGKARTSIEKYEDYGTVSKAVCATLPSVFDFNDRIGIRRKEARFRELRDAWISPLLETGRVRMLTDLRPERSCAIAAFNIEGVDPDRLATDMLERHNMRIGSIHLQDRPELTGNYLAAGLNNSVDELERFSDALNEVLQCRY